MNISVSLIFWSRFVDLANLSYDFNWLNSSWLSMFELLCQLWNPISVKASLLLIFESKPIKAL